MTGNTIFDTLLIAVFVCAALSALLLLLVDAPYGRHQQAGWGPKINTRVGWVLMESPASLLFFFFYFSGENAGSTACIVLLVLWQLHYFHRSFVYPFQIKVKPGDKVPLIVILAGALYCGVNGYLNGSYVSTYGSHLAAGWTSDPRFWIGIVIFGFGYYLNKKSDQILRNLRKDKSEGYKIPYGFGFRYVSMPNYLGEIITWIGFSIAAWSLAGVSFVVFTMANLIPRALANHKWYLETFEDYPKDRKAIIPGLL
ncbi:MAG: 3-oxo-5-alpha-steroid 4-dehydrogenase [Gammaproteobacteria bacterium]|nr:MAG: 3-oxo-5-alpha-steroid 4-dehydrogenase [Gammaproteobacteria bacterium]